MRPATWKPARVSTRGRTSPAKSTAALVERRLTVSVRTGRTSSVATGSFEQAARHSTADSAAMSGTARRAGGMARVC